MGTIEPLATSPISDLQIVLAKFLAALTFYVILWAPTVLYFMMFLLSTGERSAAPIGAIGSSYLILFLMGMFYLAIGCFASVVTRNQIIAAVVSFALIILVFFSGLLAIIIPNSTPMFRDLFVYFSAFEHLGDFSKGIIDSRPIVFYLTMTAFVLYLTLQVFQYRKWRS